MTWVLKALGLGLIIALLVGVLALAFVVRLAPNDPLVWNVAIDDLTAAEPGPCTDQIRPLPNGARVVCLLQGEPEEILAKLSLIATAYPRTFILAGAPREGRMTWVSRTRIMGYPDYTTAEVTVTPSGVVLRIFARQRFGRGDWGVNAGRLKAWLSGL